MISIYNYFDYRQFLRDFYEEKKRENLFFSYRFIGGRVGMDSSFLIKVLQGNLHISNKKIEKFIEVCNLSEKAAQYFETLVYFCKAKTEKERKIYFEKLFAIDRAKAKKIDVFQYEFFQKWYYSAVWSLLNFYKFNGNFAELADMLVPSISVNDAKQAIRLCEKLKLIEKGHDGYYEVKDLNLTTGKEWHSLAINQYQQEMIKLAGESLERFHKDERNVSTVTMNIPQEIMAEVDDVISEFRKALVKQVNSYKSSENDRVFQLNVQLFPMTKKQGGVK